MTFDFVKTFDLDVRNPKLWLKMLANMLVRTANRTNMLQGRQRRGGPGGQGPPTFFSKSHWSFFQISKFCNFIFMVVAQCEFGGWMD